TYNAVPSLIAALFLFAVSAIGENVNIESFTWDSIFAVVYLGFVASVGGIVAYFKLGQVSPPFQASICFLIFPVVALLISCYINGEVLSEQSLVMMIPLLCGILLTKAPKGIFKLRTELKTVRN
ncbi:EamA family transporter, partial [Vibrio sp. 10N.222.54.F6]